MTTGPIHPLTTRPVIVCPCYVAMSGWMSPASMNGIHCVSFNSNRNESRISELHLQMTCQIKAVRFCVQAVKFITEKYVNSSHPCATYMRQ